MFRPLETDILVIGAGPAGLTAAYLLTKAGVRTTIIEADPNYVGGISRTVNYKGFLLDIGGHRFFSKSREVMDLWSEILPDDFIERPRLSRIYYNGRFFAYPLNAFEALDKLGYFESLRCILSYSFRQLSPHANPKTFRKWVSNQFGDRLYSIFFKTYTEKVWGMSCDEISADWAAQRIEGISFRAALAALRKSFRRGAPAVGKDSEPIKTLTEHFHYPRKGPGMMWEAAAAKIRGAGGQIVMATTFSGIRRDKATGLIRVETRGPDGEFTTFAAGHVISSAPMRDLVRALGSEVSCAAEAERLRYRDFLMVALIVRKPHVFPDNWIYIHEQAVKVGRIQNFRAWSPEMVPDDSLTCLGLEYFCFEGDGLWAASDAELIARARTELAQIGLAAEADCVDGCVIRQAKAYPIYDDQYKANVEAIRNELSQRIPNLHPVGRNGMHKYNNQDHAMMTAMLTVRNILSGESIYDVWKVNDDAEFHEMGQPGEQEALGSFRLAPRRLQA